MHRGGEFSLGFHAGLGGSREFCFDGLLRENDEC